MQEAKKSNVGLWLLGGCALIVLLGLAAVVGGVFWGTSKLSNMAEEMSDPAAREKKAKEILGASALPPGYHAGVSISMGLAKTARLGDVPGAISERGFVYNDSMGSGESKIAGYVAGNGANVFDEMGTRLRTDELLANGTFDVNGQRVGYSTRRGEVTLDNQAVAGFFTIFTIDCSGDDRERWAVWFEKAAPEATGGTVTNAEEMKAFFGHLNLCR